MKPALGKTGSLVTAALVFALVAGLAFLLTRTGAGEVPPMPRASFSEEEARAAASRLAERAAAYRPAEPDGELERLLADLGRIEAGVDPDPQRGEAVARAMKAFSEAAQARIAADRARYFRQGDHLAERFGRAVTGLLRAARRDGLAGARAKERELVEEIERLGGSFLSRATERGFLGEDGALDGPDFLPAVLFLARWRGLAGEGRVQAFEPAERRAYLDFLAAFSSRDAVPLRLEASDSLAALDPAYDGVLARALVLHQGGRTGEARAVLEAAIEAGRDDDTALRFARFLAQ